MLPRLNSRVSIALGGFFLLISIGGYFVLNFLENTKSMDSYVPISTLLLFVGVLFLAGVALLMLGYLRFGYVRLDEAKSSVDFGDPASASFDTLSKQLQDIKQRLEATGPSNAAPLGEAERTSLVSFLGQQIQATFTSDVATELESRYAQQFDMRAAIRDLETYARRMESRIEGEIDALSRRGTINLTIGVLTTLIAVAILASNILFTAGEGDFVQLSTHFIPRLTLSLFIEVFSFFFLRLYSLGLGEIKYFQNEMTNIQSRFIALLRAIHAGDKASLAKILQAFSATERNFVLKKERRRPSLKEQNLSRRTFWT
jgi:hypothetical protein